MKPEGTPQKATCFGTIVQFRFNRYALMKLLILALFILHRPFLLAQSTFDRWRVPPAGESSLAARSIAYILQRHFSHSHEAILINPMYNGSQSRQLQGDLLNEVIHLIDAKLCVRFYYPRSDFVRPRFMNVFVVDGYASFRKIYATMHYSKYDSSGRYLVIMTGGIEEDFVRAIFEDLWVLDIVNVNVVFCGPDYVPIYTTFPYTKDHCGTVEPLLWLNVTHDLDELMSVDLYPDRMKNFFGCTLTGGTHEAKPYTILQKRNNSSEYALSGFEGDLVDLLMIKLNFTVRYEISPNGSSWGFARKIGHSTGLMKMIQEEQVDFGVGCMAFAYDRHKYLKPGIAHYTSKVLFAVPAGRPFSAFEKLFRPFSFAIWSLIWACLSIGAGVICALQLSPREVRDFVYGFGNNSPLLNMLNIFFGGALSRTPRRNFARALLVLWVGFCFVIRTVYQGSLYLHLQRALNHDPLETMEDIDRSQIRYHMMEIGQRYFLSMPHVLKRATFIQAGKDSLGSTIEKLGKGSIYGVVLIPLDYAAYHNKIFPKEEFVYITKEHVGVYPVGFYYPKKSRLTKVFDNQIRNIQSTGLIDFWLRRYGDYDFFRKSRLRAGPRKLNNQHLAGGYQVFGCWLILSCIVFGLELLSRQVILLRKILDFFTV